MSTSSKYLAVILAKRDPEKYKSIIERASLNAYHDFKFDQIPGHPEYGDTICPKIQLVEDLSRFPELNDIRKAVMDGEYDDAPDEVDDFSMRLVLIEQGTPDAIFQLLGFKVPSVDEREKTERAKNSN